MESGARFVFEEVGGVRTLVVTGPWTSDAEEALLREGADALVLNHARGFEVDLERGELEFLDERFRLRCVRLLDRGVLDISPIYRLHDSLEELSIQAAPQADLDLAELPGLRRLAGDWSLIGPTLGALDDLREMSTWRFDQSDLSPFTVHTQLERLTVKDAGALESLYGLVGHDALRYLEVRLANRLVDISVLANVGPSLEDLVLEKCRAIESLDPVASAGKLRFLEIGDCGDFPSASALRALDHLAALYAWGSTRFADGDLSVLSVLPALREIRMQDRRHYRPHVSELAATLASRH